MDLALNLSEKILDTFNYKSLYRIFTLPAFKKKTMSESEYNLFKRILLKAIEKAKVEGYWKEAASCHYNLGNRMRNTSYENFSEVFHNYRMASKYDHSYKEREYFWREIGGLLFLCGKYGYSEKCYRIALELDGTSECKAQRADALMFSGKYREALDLFKEYSTGVDNLEPEFALKMWVLNGLMKKLGLEDQTRNSEEATKFADVKGIPLEEVHTRLVKALELDGLCGLAWYNLGIYNSSRNDYADASLAFLMAAIAQPNDIDSWINLIICIFNSPEYYIKLPSVLSFAYRINGENLIIRLSQKIEDQSAGVSMPIRKLLINLINFLSENARKLGDIKEQEHILRIINPDGTYRIIKQDVKFPLKKEETGLVKE